LNDALQPEFGSLAIRYSLLIIAITPVFAGMSFWAAAASYQQDMTRAESA
jgi:hypothetical protein